ncbi:MAG TPA: hypothetical protein VFW09_07580 [Solirubrobacteraceae bacterium]|nr:hypothetical protein [Solirubrobacteraceae bacterium]
MRRMLTMSTVGLAAALALPSVAVGAPTTRHFTEVEAGARLSTHGKRYEDVYKIKRSPDGVGTVIRDSVLSGNTFPASGTAQAISYFKDGRLRSTESFTLGIPRADGVGTITGSGKCTRGSKAHRLETCNYKFSGTYDLRTGITQITLKGTETPAAGGKPGKKHKHPHH